MTMISKLLGGGAVLAMCAATSGCVIVGANVKADDWDHLRYPRLLGAEVDARAPEVTIVVNSNGCTEKSQFAYTVEPAGDHTYHVGFRRTTEDRCKALMAEGKRLTWTFSELGIPGGSEIVVMNRVGR